MQSWFRMLCSLFPTQHAALHEQTTCKSELQLLIQFQTLAFKQLNTVCALLLSTLPTSVIQQQITPQGVRLYSNDDRLTCQSASIVIACFLHTNKHFCRNGIKKLTYLNKGDEHSHSSTIILAKIRWNMLMWPLIKLTIRIINTREQ